MDMQPVYSAEEFEKARSRQLLPLRCATCNRIFRMTKANIQGALWTSRNGHCKGDFCSHKCRAKSQQKQFKVSCHQCGKPFQRTRSLCERSRNQFCSHACATRWNNTHKTKGTRVSKLERWLAQELPRLYPNLDFHFNRTDAINGELDIFIPSLKLAFELNGIFHYEPIYGPDKLASIKSNDERKFQACVERNIELCILDVSSMNRFTPLGGRKFLKIILSVIAARQATPSQSSAKPTA